MNVACASCGHTFSVGGAQPGARVMCPGCETLLAVPQPPAKTKAAPTPTPVSAPKEAPAKRPAYVHVNKPHKQTHAQQKTMRHILAGTAVLVIIALLGLGAAVLIHDSSSVIAGDPTKLDDVQLVQNNNPPIIKLPTDKKTTPKPDPQPEPKSDPEPEPDPEPKPQDKGEKKTPQEKEPPQSDGGRVGGVLVTEFMDLPAKGQRFVIIADRSGSMAAGRWWWDYDLKKERFGKKALIDYLKDELLKVVEDLRKKNGQLYIILFDSDITEQPVNNWARTRTEFDIVKEWVQGIEETGETNPLPAFHRAFQLNPPPDVIFFMSDGVIPYDVLGPVDQLQKQLVAKQKKVGKKNPSPVVIHTIQLDVPGMDSASLYMSYYASKRPLNPGIQSLIESEKQKERINRANPASRQRFLKQRQNQIHQMRELARRYDGQFRHVENFEEIFKDNDEK